MKKSDFWKGTLGKQIAEIDLGNKIQTETDVHFKFFERGCRIKQRKGGEIVLNTPLKMKQFSEVLSSFIKRTEICEGLQND